MSPKNRAHHRMSVVLNMVTAFVIVILLAQLWLFTIAIEQIGISFKTAAVALSCSLLACIAICGLIRLFLRAEARE